MPKIPGKQTDELKPFWQTTDQRAVRLYQGNSLDVLRRMPSQSVHCVITSPPYWGLRDYQTGQWVDGDADCDHVEKYPNRGKSTLTSGGIGQTDDGAAYQAIVRQFDARCGKCGAVRIDSQLGSEKTPDEFVANMVAVFREVRRVLRDDGTLWLNLGSSYCGSNVKDADETFTLRDDLTPDELEYVLSELAAHVGEGSEVSEPC